MESTAFLAMEDLLEPVESIDFCTASHRKIPDSLRKKIDFGYFRAPLASGSGIALFATRAKSISENQTKVTKIPSDRPFVILLHGLGDDAAYPYWHWLEVLTKQNLTVLSFEWDGHGSTGASHLDFQSATRSIPLLLQKLFSEPGRGVFSHSLNVPPIYLVGHSVGASLALIAATRPEVAKLIKAVIAVSPVLGRVPEVSYRRHERMGFMNPMSWIRDFGARLGTYRFSGLQMFSGLASQELPIRTRLGLGVEEQASAFLQETFEERRILKHVQSPVLWIHGAKDRYAPYAHALELMGEVPTLVTRHLELKRTHLSLAFSAAAPKYIAQFIENHQAKN